MSSLERLAAAAPAAAPPASAWKGRRHAEDRLYLMARDPHSAFAAWEITPGLHRRAEAVARAADAAIAYQLRVERRRDGGAPAPIAAVADLPDAVGGEGWYFDLPQSGGECRAVLGVVLPGGFEPLLHSRWIPVPPDGPCAETGEWDPNRGDLEVVDCSADHPVPDSEAHSGVRRGVTLGASGPPEWRP
jgi:hypothetical protein